MRLNAWSLMVIVAIAAVLFAAVRVESAPSAGIAIIGTCVWYLGYRRYSAALTQRRSSGLKTNGLQKAGLLLGSAIYSMVVIGSSDVAFLIGYFGLLKIADKTVLMSHWTPYNDPVFIATGVVTGGILALCVASSLRRTMDREMSRCSRWWHSLSPIGLAILLGTILSAEEMRERYRFCRMMAHYHAGPQAQADVPEKAKLHAWLKQWYERASIRPWLPVHPTRIPPNLD